MEDERKMAYTEVYTIINMMDKEFIEKIPKKIKSIISKQMDKEYKPNIKSNVSLKEQNLQPKTYTILAMLDYNFWCEDEKEKEDLAQLFLQNEIKYQEELRKRYNPDNIFKNNTNIEENTNLPTIVKKENIVVKIINFIKNIIKKK